MNSMPANYLWFIPLLPFAGFLINGTVGRRLPRGLVSAVALLFTAVPACLVAGHAPFAWVRTPHEAAHNAVVLEAVARMAYNTLTLRASAEGVSQALLDRHYFRKHGANATYGQK